jgi:hypothetical protein
MEGTLAALAELEKSDPDKAAGVYTYAWKSGKNAQTDLDRRRQVQAKP